MLLGLGVVYVGILYTFTVVQGYTVMLMNLNNPATGFFLLLQTLPKL